MEGMPFRRIGFRFLCQPGLCILTILEPTGQLGARQRFGGIDPDTQRSERELCLKGLGQPGTPEDSPRAARLELTGQVGPSRASC